VDFSPVQLLIVLLIVLVIFGAKRLPEIGRSLGSSAREFKKGISADAGDDAPAQQPPSSTPRTGGDSDAA
jgi:sec-independent protein translocase protein TatA